MCRMETLKLKTFCKELYALFVIQIIYFMLCRVKAQRIDTMKGMSSSVLWVLNFTMNMRLEPILLEFQLPWTTAPLCCLISLSWLPHGRPYGNDLVSSHVEGLILFSLVAWFLTFGDSPGVVLYVVLKLLLCSLAPRLPGLEPVKRICFCHQPLLLPHAQHLGGFKEIPLERK